MTQQRRRMEPGQERHGVTTEEAGCSKLSAVHSEALTAAAGADAA